MSFVSSYCSFAELKFAVPRVPPESSDTWKARNRRGNGDKAFMQKQRLAPGSVRTIVVLDSNGKAYALNQEYKATRSKNGFFRNGSWHTKSRTETQWTPPTKKKIGRKGRPLFCGGKVVKDLNEDNNNASI